MKKLSATLPNPHNALILFRMGLFAAAHGWGERKKPPPLPL